MSQTVSQIRNAEMYKKDIVQPASDDEVVGGDPKLDPLRSLPAQLAPDCHLGSIFLRTLRAAPESEQYIFARSEVIYKKILTVTNSPMIPEARSRGESFLRLELHGLRRVKTMRRRGMLRAR